MVRTEKGKPNLLYNPFALGSIGLVDFSSKAPSQEAYSLRRILESTSVKSVRVTTA